MAATVVATSIPALAAALVAAVAGPSLLAYSVPPSTTALNQLLAVGLWGLVALAVAVVPSRSGPGQAVSARPSGVGAAVLLPLAVAAAAALSWAVHPIPASLAASSLALLLAAAVCAAAGAWARGRADAPGVFAAFGGAWALAGAASAAVAVAQVFATVPYESWWIARSGIPGRAVGNLRQPNHLATVLLWALVGLVAWLELRRAAGRAWAGEGVGGAGSGPAGWGRRRETAAAFALAAALVLALVLSGSRTGVVGLGLLAAWGLLDRGLSRRARGLLLATVPLYALAWWGLSWWADAQGLTFGARQRLAESDVSGSRFRIWSDTWALVQAHPWAGVGWGQFNFAWSLTPFPQRPVAFFDHTHNLPLQWAVELGLPLAAGLLGVVGWGLWRAWGPARQGGPAGVAARCGLMVVLLVGLHSLLEYPLWYAHFLMPAAFAWGYALGRGPGAPAPGAAEIPAGARGLAAAGLLCAAGTAFAVQDYLRVASVFQSWAGAPPLAERIADARDSVFFAHHAHYAAATTKALPSAEQRRGFEVASRHILDTRLMIAWARAFEEAGDRDRALHLTQRLREFRNPSSRVFFAPCNVAAGAGATAAPASSTAPAAEPPPFPCSAPSRPLAWQDFLPR
jgi:hypothetical protein